MHCYIALQSLSILFHYLIQPISLMFCGHLGKTQLASAAMAISVRFYNVHCDLHIGVRDVNSTLENYCQYKV